jgi:hypothetical protein
MGRTKHFGMDIFVAMDIYRVMLRKASGSS